MSAIKKYLQIDSPSRIKNEKFLEQIFAVGRHVERDSVLPPQDPFPQFPQGRPVEGKRPAD